MDDKIIERFKHVMSDKTPVFNSYVLRKANGEILDIELLPPDELKEMFIDEVIIDNLIAALFDVKKDIVTKRRYKYGIKLGQTFSKKSMQEMKEIIADFLQAKEESLSVENVLVPMKIIFYLEDDLIIAPCRVFESDGGPYPFCNYEELQEIDNEAFCVRISRVRNEIKYVLNEIIDFLMENIWDDEVYFEREDDKVVISAILYTDEDSKTDKISLAVSLQISGLHPSGDLIFDSEYDLQTGMITFRTDTSDFEMDDGEIQEIFMDCWNGINRYVQVQKKFDI
ncbi:hypothetical protein [Paenibacillus sp. J2TS4]|uniref:hypothetical protein n=1 Tax=Paenibacillus sp. J2TS4 TaxID=2807194 RepID=UPI001B039E64|nr:hypothetical protein [Paenibacillus sp. J2TS4]GIP34243.1 hypothetical protein J2TS4_34530 [Paenibacillus sp. J2TS4]